MRHCSPDELIDLAEGARSESSMPHLGTCALCRRQLLEVRELLVEVRDVAVPEPSAAQWARLSTRVSEAVASEVERSQRPWTKRWLGRDSWAWSLPVAAAAVLAIALAVPGIIGVNRPSPVSAPAAEGPAAAAAGASSAVVAREPDGHAPDDPSLGLMFELADVVDLDSDPAPVLAMGAGTLDEAVGDLSSDERHELARLLEEAMHGPGA